MPVAGSLNPRIVPRRCSRVHLTIRLTVRPDSYHRVCFWIFIFICAGYKALGCCFWVTKVAEVGLE